MPGQAFVEVEIEAKTENSDLKERLEELKILVDWCYHTTNRGE